MANLFIDYYTNFKQYDINTSDNIFKQILEIRKTKFDSERFFLSYISNDDLSKYDLSNKESICNFRNIRFTYMDPVKEMAGCNNRPEMLEKGMRYAGIKISDPNKKILGQFDIINNNMFYSPIFPRFYEERDLVKFANDIYFTTITFDELIMNQINFTKRFYVHIRNSSTIKEMKEYGQFIFEEISKEEMINCATNPQSCDQVLKKYIKR